MNLANADLYGANLRGIILFRASLKNANIMQACLDNAHLKGADLRVAEGLTAFQISKAHCWDDETKWPEGFSPIVISKMHIDS